MTDFEKMTLKELISLKTDINKELEKREKQEYDKALRKFTDAFYELYVNFPHRYCFTNGETWKDLYENNDWNF